MANQFPNLIKEQNKSGETDEYIAREVLGCSRQNYNQKKSGKRDFTMEQVNKLCDHFKKSYEYLFKQ